MFYTVMVTTYNDGTDPKKALYSYDTKDLALAQYHQQMGNAMKSENVATQMIIVISESGERLRSEYYVRAVVETVEETTEESEE